MFTAFGIAVAVIGLIIAVAAIACCVVANDYDQDLEE